MKVNGLCMKVLNRFGDWVLEYEGKGRKGMTKVRCLCGVREVQDTVVKE